MSERGMQDLERTLGFARLNPTWAKIEIVLGLGAAAGGMLTALRATEAPFVASGWCLAVLGGYLALAGQRSHVYQSGNRLAAYIVERLGPRGLADDSKASSIDSGR